MKRIFAYLTVAAALLIGASSCIKDVFPEGTDPTPALESEGISIEVSYVNDNAFEFTLVPKGKASYYSYLVTASPAEPDPAQLYAVKYSGITQGTVKYDMTPRYSVQVEDLVPNKPYYVYAVAGSVEGNVSPVTSISVTTTDGVAPEIVDFAYQGNVVQLKFSEPVTYVEGKEIWAKAVPFLYPTGTPSIEKTVGKVTSSGGNTALVTFEEIVQPGSLYVVNVPAGAFIDSVGQGTQAVSSEVLGVDSKGNPVFADGSVYGYVSAGEIEIEVPEQPETLVDWGDMFTIFNCKTPISQIKSDAVIVTVIHEEAGKTVTSEYTLTLNQQYGSSTGYDLVAFLPEEPERGDNFTFKAIEGAVVDIYGNTSPEVTIGPILYSYGFSVEDVLGTYENSGESAYGPTYDEEPWTFTVSETDDAEAGDVLITEWYGLPCKVYGNFDGDGGVLTILMDGDWKFMCGFVDEGVYYEFFLAGYYNSLASSADGGDIQLYMKEKGSFYTGNDYPGYLYFAYAVPASGNIEEITNDDMLGYDYNVFMPEFGPASSASGVAPASARTYYPMPMCVRPTVSFDKVLVKK